MSMTVESTLNAETAHEAIRAIAGRRAAHEARYAIPLSDEEADQLGDELRDMDARMTEAARSLLARVHLSADDLSALAHVLQHFSEADDDGGVTLDEREIVHLALARLLAELIAREPQLS